jgi:multiple sugar transport system ATP-binding protein
MASIALEAVTKVYANGGAAARDLTLEIADGELLVLLGPSGSGKSTALRLIAGLEAPSAGRILIGGRDVTHVEPQRRDLAMVFQSYALYPHMTVRENLAFGLRVRRVEAALVEARVAEAAAILGIEALLDRRPAQLSGGQRQRVALGRAIVREPQAFLLDEPLSNLDPLLRASTRAELALLHRRLGTTTVYVTHDQEEAMTLGTRIAVMRDGRIEQLDRPLELFRRPANTFVAGFVGSPAMNLWRGLCAPAAGRMVFTVPAFSIEAATGHGLPALAGPMVLGVRPHDVTLTAPDEGDGRGRVDVVEPLGATTLAHLRTDSGPHGLVRVVVPSDTALGVGDVAGFRLRRDRLHLFDEPTGVRLSGL